MPGNLYSFINRYFLHFAILTTKHCFRTHVDGQEVLNVSPGKGGFWEFGDFAKRFPGINNPWANNTKMTPFDQDVSIYFTNLAQFDYCL